MRFFRLFFLTLFVAFGSSNQSAAQMEASKWQHYPKISMGLTGNTSYINYGWTSEYQFRPKWTLNWNLEVQARMDSIVQLHGSMGLIGGPAFMGWAINNSWTPKGIGTSILIGLMIMAIPDGISYHIPVGYRWDISPYVNVLGFDYVPADSDVGKNYLLYSASAGVRCSYWFADRFFAKAFVETRKAGYLEFNYGLGVALGWSVPLVKTSKFDN
jgi:hypothetical protein